MLYRHTESILYKNVIVKYFKTDCIIISGLVWTRDHLPSLYLLSFATPLTYVSRSIFINYIILILPTEEITERISVSIKRTHRARAEDGIFHGERWI